MQNRNSLRIQTLCKILDGETICSVFEVRMDELRSAVLGLRPFLTTESPLKLIKNVSCFTLEAIFALKIFKFLS